MFLGGVFYTKDKKEIFGIWPIKILGLRVEAANLIHIYLEAYWWLTSVTFVKGPLGDCISGVIKAKKWQKMWKPYTSE